MFHKQDMCFIIMVRIHYNTLVLWCNRDSDCSVKGPLRCIWWKSWHINHLHYLLAELWHAMKCFKDTNVWSMCFCFIRYVVVTFGANRKEWRVFFKIYLWPMRGSWKLDSGEFDLDGAIRKCFSSMVKFLLFCFSTWLLSRNSLNLFIR